MEGSGNPGAFLLLKMKSQNFVFRFAMCLARLACKRCDPDDVLWSTKDERTIQVSKMEDDHLKSAYRIESRRLHRMFALQKEMINRGLLADEEV
jgi:hypothetical protein